MEATPPAQRHPAETSDIKLTKEGLSDWTNTGNLLKSHENSQEHTTNMAKWKELELRHRTGSTIDAKERSLLEAERQCWRDVITRLIAIIQSLAKRNLALRGSSSTLYKEHNGHFMKEVYGVHL
ncbi:hypothetical protein N1851_006706 [Merluccius polli]|uniref:Uncharacterized protein n=1 Tax=Merluccius polli TaxID=89951 RepID=A0AA47N5F6_MERPO|nr:hypothetical protein N1851_006706 [Merluccius polli]